MFWTIGAMVVVSFMILLRRSVRLPRRGSRQRTESTRLTTSRSIDDKTVRACWVAGNASHDRIGSIFQKMNQQLSCR